MFEIEKQNTGVTISYQSKITYGEILNKVEMEYDMLSRKIGREIFNKEYEDENEFEKAVNRVTDNLDKKLREITHKQYYAMLPYSLIKLKGQFKALSKQYGKYLVMDYTFKGVFLDENDNLIHNELFGEDELVKGYNGTEYIGEPFSKLTEYINAQLKCGNIHIEEFEFTLLENNRVRKSGKRKRTHIPKGIRHEVFKRDNYTCVECGAKKDDGATLHIDHKIPVSKGGTDEMDNLQTLCKDCNLNKNNLLQMTGK